MKVTPTRKDLLEHDPEFCNIVVHDLMRREPVDIAKARAYWAGLVGLICDDNAPLRPTVPDECRNNRQISGAQRDRHEYLGEDA